MTNSCTQSYNKLYMGFWCAISSQYDESCVSVKQLNLHDCINLWSPVNINTFCALCSDNSAKALHSSFQEKNPHGSQDVQPTLYRIKQIQRNTITLTEKSNQLWEGAFIKVFHLLSYLNEFYCKPLTDWLIEEVVIKHIHSCCSIERPWYLVLYLQYSCWSYHTNPSFLLYTDF